jgi:hypothetical protein
MRGNPESDGCNSVWPSVATVNRKLRTLQPGVSDEHRQFHAVRCRYTRSAADVAQLQFTAQVRRAGARRSAALRIGDRAGTACHRAPPVAGSIWRCRRPVRVKLRSGSAVRQRLLRPNDRMPWTRPVRMRQCTPLRLSKSSPSTAADRPCRTRRRRSHPC